MRIWLRVVQCLFYRDWGKQVCLSVELNLRMWIYTKVSITNLWPFAGHLRPMETDKQWRQRIVLWLKILAGRSQNGWVFSSLADRGVELGTFGNNTSKWSQRDVIRDFQPDLKFRALTRFNQSATALSTLLVGQRAKLVFEWYLCILCISFIAHYFLSLSSC